MNNAMKFKDLKSFIKAVNDMSKKTNAQTTGLSMEGCKTFDNSDIYLIHAVKGTSKITKMKAFKSLLEDE